VAVAEPLVETELVTAESEMVPSKSGSES
jgi:hypothetical protein